MVQQTAPVNLTINYGFLAANTLLLNVFYNQMSYSCSQESPAMTIDALIATFWWKFWFISWYYIFKFG
jgi:hypothetical protein